MKLIMGVFLIVLGVFGIAFYMDSVTNDEKMKAFFEYSKPSEEYLIKSHELAKVSSINMPVGVWKNNGGDNAASIYQVLIIENDGVFYWNVDIKKDSKDFLSLNVRGLFDIKGSTLQAKNIEGKGLTLIPTNKTIIVLNVSDTELKLMDYYSQKEIVFTKK